MLMLNTVLMLQSIKIAINDPVTTRHSPSSLATARSWVRNERAKEKIGYSAAQVSKVTVTCRQCGAYILLATGLLGATEERNVGGMVEGSGKKKKNAAC